MNWVTFISGIAMFALGFVAGMSWVQDLVDEARDCLIKAIDHHRMAVDLLTKRIRG
jgi:hypothetical protein